MFRLFGYFCFALFLLITSLSCDSSEPPPVVPPPDLRKITLSVEDVSCTEVWLSIKTDSITFPSEIILLKDTVAQAISLCCSDTVLYIDSLLPNKPHNYKAILTTDTTIKSETVTAQTLDTTSHNFTWQSWEFGEHSSSVLYDVAIIDENNIWAVGEIYMNDSLGNPDPHAYNAAHWDGSQWELKRIMFYTICGQQNLSSYPARSIQIFNENDIWIGVDGDQITRIENGVQTTTICLPWSFTINKIWGTSSEDLYVVGNGGNIAHYSGVSGGWQKIESGTELNINDIWGDYNDKTGEWEILAVAANIFQGFDKEVLKITNDNVEILNKNGIEEPLFGIWFIPNRKYYLVGSGTYEKFKLHQNIWKGDPLDITSYFENKIKGQDVNDVFIAGAFGEFLHFNGISWKSYMNQIGLTNGAYLSVDARNKLVATTGYEGIQAKIIIGQKY